MVPWTSSQWQRSSAGCRVWLVPGQRQGGCPGTAPRAGHPRVGGQGGHRGHRDPGRAGRGAWVIAAAALTQPQASALRLQRHKWQQQFQHPSERFQEREGRTLVCTPSTQSLPCSSICTLGAVHSPAQQDCSGCSAETPKASLYFVYSVCLSV